MITKVENKNEEITSSRQSRAILQSSRIEWIDVAKGVGILLVVLGHVLTSGMWYNVIYTFHMPMFFILAGVVYRTEPVASQVPKRLLSLMLPYFCFLLVVMMMRNALDYGYGASVSHIIRGDTHQLLLGFKGGRFLTGDYGTFWFVSCLFLSLIVYNAIRRRLRKPLGGAMIAVIVALLVICYPLRWFSWPWDASVVPLAIVFIWTGEFWCAVFGQRGDRANNRILLVLAAIVAALGLFLVLPFDMKYGHYGTHLLSVVVAVALSHLFFIGCMRLARVPRLCAVLVQFGQASLVILFLQRFFVLHLADHIPAAAIFFAAAIIPFLFWLLVKRSPLLVRQALLGERRSRRKTDNIASTA